MSPDTRHAVVTGGCGFIGSRLVARLTERGDEVTVFDAVPPPDGTAHPSARYVTGDVRDPAGLGRVIGRGTDVVYHLAALVGVDRYLSSPGEVVDVNLGGTGRVLELAHRTGAKVVLASTSEVFGKNPAVPWREDGDRVLGSTASDRWSYATSKALAEHLAYGFARRSGLDVTILRYFNVYGPRQRPAYLVSRSIHRALNGRPVLVYDGGRQTRCLTYVDDAVTATILAADHPDSGGEAFNVGSMVETTVREVVSLVEQLTGTAVDRVELDAGRRLGPAYEDVPRRVPETAKARQLLGWRCTTPLREGLARTIDWARANRWWLDLPDSGAA